MLPDASHKMLVREIRVHSLLVDLLTQRDMGTYMCIATKKKKNHRIALFWSLL